MARKTSLEVARELAAMGLQVLPAGYKEKAPLIPWKKWQNTSTAKMLSQWFGAGARNYWVMTGPMSGVVVLDCDNEAAETFWREHGLGDAMDATAQSRSKKGIHYWFRLPEGAKAKDWEGWANHPGEGDGPDEPSFDVRGTGGGVIAPPSVHETGHVYEWCGPVGLADAVEAPEELRRGSAAHQAVGGSQKSGEGHGDAGAGGRSMLSHLLANLPDSGGRNVWMSKVAGHYAKTFRNMEDAYWSHVRQANSRLAQPLDDAELEKTGRSIWEGEHERHPERGISAETGWIQGNANALYTQVKVGKGDEAEYDIAKWANFDLRVQGVVIEEDGTRSYDVILVRERDAVEIRAVLAGRTLGDSKALNVWLASYGVAILAPESIAPRSPAANVRLGLYLESQEAPEAQITKHLGWNDDAAGFLTHDEVIREDGPHPFAGIRPDPKMRKGSLAPFKYGFADGGIAEAQDVLSDVLTFQDETTCSVYGAWWAACLLKPQIEARTSLFPFMAIEAASESGKTTGFFGLMNQLNGNIQGETQSTKAATRDYIGANRSGIVWIDDLDDPAPLFELLRLATGGGSTSKKGEDRTQNVSLELVSPIVISGESLGLNQQKALLDRAIQIEVQSPVGRTSLHGDYEQWEDIVELRAKYPESRGGLAVLAGTLVQMALAEADQIPAALRATKSGRGRAVHKVSILRTGARLLDAMLCQGGPAKARRDAWAGKGTHARRVDAWLDSQQDMAERLPEENTLTLKILPWALRAAHWPTRPTMQEPAVFVEGEDSTEGPTVWFNTNMLAESWERHRHGRISERTESAAGLTQQAEVLRKAGHIDTGKAVRVAKGDGKWGAPRYRPVRSHLAELILDRSRAE